VTRRPPSSTRKSPGHVLYRIATETRSYRADDLSGGGAAADPGRWNDKGEAVLYTATSVALATLETAAHVKAAGLPLNKFLVEIILPRRAWTRKEVLDVHALGPAWKAIPPGAASVRAGSAWLRSGRCAVLLVPSVIAPEEFCVLVNPSHVDARGMRAIVRRAMEYDVLFR
jgi:RES domain-containing protein